MFKYRKLAFVLLLMYLISIPASAFSLSKDSETGAFNFFEVNGSGNITANSSKPIADMNAAQTEIAVKSKSIASGIIAICVIISIFLFAFNIVKLAKNADNPNERRKAITGIMVSGIAFAGFGGYGTVAGLFMNLLKAPEFSLMGTISSGTVSALLSGMSGV